MGAVELEKGRVGYMSHVRRGRGDGEAGVTREMIFEAVKLASNLGCGLG